jgi:hypothetical protein
LFGFYKTYFVRDKVVGRLFVSDIFYKRYSEDTLSSYGILATETKGQSLPHKMSAVGDCPFVSDYLLLF